MTRAADNPVFLRGIVLEVLPGSVHYRVETKTETNVWALSGHLRRQRVRFELGDAVTVDPSFKHARGMGRITAPSPEPAEEPEDE